MSIKHFVLRIIISSIFIGVDSVIYRRIRELREDRDLRQCDIAKYLNISQVAYSHYELGKRDIPTEVLLALADYYKTSTDYLLGRTDISAPYPKK